MATTRCIEQSPLFYCYRISSYNYSTLSNVISTLFG